MPNPSKGNRTRMSTRLPTVVADTFEEIRVKTGVSSESQLLSDVLALITNHPEHVRELNQRVLPDLGIYLSELGKYLSELGVEYQAQAKEDLPLTA